MDIKKNQTKKTKKTKGILFILSIIFIMLSCSIFATEKVLPEGYTQEMVEIHIQNYIKLNDNKITWNTPQILNFLSYSQNPFINGSFYIKN